MRIYTGFIIIIICLTAAACSPKGSEKKQAGSGIFLEISFRYGKDLSPEPYENIYAVWIENRDHSYIQNISICKKLVSGRLTGIALPFWKMNRYNISDRDELDAVTGATQARRDFTVTAELRDPKIRQFSLFFEVDRSYDRNDWFTDQPAILYKADIDLDKQVPVYELKFCGWTPNKETQNVIPGTPEGVIQKELRYITNRKMGAGFGERDNLNSATNMVHDITVRIKR